MNINDVEQTGSKATMFTLYVLTTCRIVTVLVFATSFLAKVHSLAASERAISSFGLLPRSLSKAAAWLLLTSELAVVLLLIAGGLLLTVGFLLAALLLLVFSVALGAVLVRNVQTSCNCFGVTEKLVGPYDIVRNAGLLLFALVGLSVSIGSDAGQGSLSIAEWILLGAGAALFLAIWLQINEIAELLRQS